MLRISVCPSVRLPLSFLKIESLVFSDIVHDDRWPRYLVNDGAAFFFKKKKKNWRPEFGQSSQNRTQNSFFCHFLKFVSLVFLEITYNDAAIHLEEVKITKIFFGLQCGPKSCPKLGFHPFSQVWLISFPWNWIQW